MNLYKLPLIAVLGLLVFASTASASIVTEENAEHSSFRLSGEIPSSLKDHVELFVSETATCPTEIGTESWPDPNGETDSEEALQSRSSIYQGGRSYKDGSSEPIIGSLDAIYYISGTDQFSLRWQSRWLSTGTRAVCLYSIPGTEQCTEGGPLTRECNTYYSLADNLGTFTSINVEQLKREEAQATIERDRAQKQTEQTEREAKNAAAEAKQKQENAEGYAEERAQYAAEVAAREAKCKHEVETQKIVYTGEEATCSKEWYETFLHQIEAREASERAKRNAEWSALEAVDLAKPIRGTLSVKVSARSGKSSQTPGDTILRITTSPFAHVSLKLTRYGHHTETVTNTPSALTSRTATWEPEVTWTCNRPGGTYGYVITAKTNVGRALTKKGHFNPVSAARCHELKRHEQEAKERNARRFAEGVRQEEREINERITAWEYRCRQIGGTPVSIGVIEGSPKQVCRAPYGGTLSVPS